MSKSYATQRKYELVLVLAPSLDDEALKDRIAKIKAKVSELGGSVDRVDMWGKRQLAYPIKRCEYAHYILFVLDGNNEMNAILDRQFRIDEMVLRHIIVHKDKYAPDFIPELRTERADNFVDGRGEGRGFDRGDRASGGSYGSGSAGDRGFDRPRRSYNQGQVA